MVGFEDVFLVKFGLIGFLAVIFEEYFIGNDVGVVVLVLFGEDVVYYNFGFVLSVSFCIIEEVDVFFIGCYYE